MKTRNTNTQDHSAESGFLQLLHTDDVARILGISPKTVHKLVRAGKLACVQVTPRERLFTEVKSLQGKTLDRTIDQRKVNHCETRGPETV